MLSQTLTELVDRACTEVLSETELQELYTQAADAKQTEEVLLQLMRAGTSVSRTNLRAAKGLKSAHKTLNRHPKPPRKPRLTHYNKQMHASQVMNLPFVVTNHAFERFVARHYPDKPLQEVLEFLRNEARAAAPIRDKTTKGDAQWKSPSGIIFVVRRDKKQPLPICVTILPIDTATSEGLAKSQLQRPSSRFRNV